MAGRRVDAPDAKVVRFPPANEAKVAAKIRDVFREKQARVMVSAAACGADIIALEVGGAWGMRRVIVLPYDRDQFRKTSVIDRPGGWGDRYDRILKAIPARDIISLGKNPDDEDVYKQGNQGIIDRSLAVAREIHSPLEAVIVWDGQSRGPDDVTAQFLEEAGKNGIKAIEVLTL